MTAKGLDRRALFVGLALAALTAGTAEAQLVNGQWRVFTPQQGTRVGVQVNAPTVFAQQGYNPIVAPSQPVQFTYVPTIVMSDGRVYGNYGYGYQQVVTITPAAVMPYTVYGNGFGVVYSGTTNGLQPLPNQQTRSQQMVVQSAVPAPARAVGRRY